VDAASEAELSDEGVAVAGDERADNEARPEGDSQVPDDPQSNPEQAVDAMEQRVLGDSAAAAGEGEDEDLSPAFELDLDPEDQGTAEAGAEQSG
jgi:hypothetical protein